MGRECFIHNSIALVKRFICSGLCIVPMTTALSQSLPPGAEEQAGRQQQEQMLREQQRQQQQQQHMQPPVDVRLDDPAASPSPQTVSGLLGTIEPFNNFLFFERTKWPSEISGQLDVLIANSRIEGQRYSVERNANGGILLNENPPPKPFIPDFRKYIQDFIEFLSK
jgi:hypothetical protein